MVVVVVVVVVAVVVVEVQHMTAFELAMLMRDRGWVCRVKPTRRRSRASKARELGPSEPMVAKAFVQGRSATGRFRKILGEIPHFQTEA